MILITIDGCAAYYLRDTNAPLRTLRELAARGVAAEGMRPCNPTVTWPNHTTLVTGVTPARHSVFFNGVLVRPEPGIPARVDSQRDKADLVRVLTVYDLLHEAGYRTADVNWPCTRGAKSLDYSFPDVPDQVLHMTPHLRDEMFSTGWLQSTNDAAFRGLSAPVRDQIWTATAVHLIETRRPNLLLFHMLITDSLQHKYGPRSSAAYTALAQADAQLGEILRAVDRAGLRKLTTFIVTADHGFESAQKIIHPNVTFRKAGLLEVAKAPGIQRARAHIISEGGTAMVYLTDPSTAEADRQTVMKLMNGHEGIQEILTHTRFAEFNFPDPALNLQMADLVLVAKPGYGFSNEAQGDIEVTPVTLENGNQGHHGCLTTNPKMHAVFVAAGRGIKRGARLGTIHNTDVAPTVARLLGLTLPNVDGRVLDEILE